MSILKNGKKKRGRQRDSQVALQPCHLTYVICTILFCKMKSARGGQNQQKEMNYN